MSDNETPDTGEYPKVPGWSEMTPRGPSWEEAFVLPTVMVTFARHLLLRGLEKIEWEDFPEIGEYDWEQVTTMARDLVNVPTAPTFDQAYEALARRATGRGTRWPNQPEDGPNG